MTNRKKGSKLNEPKTCTRSSECGFYQNNHKCSGCSYQHLHQILTKKLSELTHGSTEYDIVKALENGIWEDGSKSTRGLGGRTSVDKWLYDELLKYFDLKAMTSNHIGVENKDGDIIRLKHDGHFKLPSGLEIIIEYKGYPEEGHVLGALMIAYLLRRFYMGRDYHFYFLCHSIETVKIKMPGSLALIEFGKKEGWFHGVYGLDNIELFLRDIA